MKRDHVTATSYPHGALGVDSVDNEWSGVYGEAAAIRRMERERAMAAAAAREALLQSTRLLVQAVGPRLNSYFDRPWKAGETRGTQLVVIGEKHMDREAIAAMLRG